MKKKASGSLTEKQHDEVKKILFELEDALIGEALKRAKSDGPPDGYILGLTRAAGKLREARKKIAHVTGFVLEGKRKPGKEEER
mgnify:CR=1 FL=1